MIACRQAEVSEQKLQEDVQSKHSCTAHALVVHLAMFTTLHIACHEINEIDDLESQHKTAHLPAYHFAACCVCKVEVVKVADECRWVISSHLLESTAHPKRTY